MAIDKDFLNERLKKLRGKSLQNTISTIDSLSSGKLKPNAFYNNEDKFKEQKVDSEIVDFFIRKKIEPKTELGKIKEGALKGFGDIGEGLKQIPEAFKNYVKHKNWGISDFASGKVYSDIGADMSKALVNIPISEVKEVQDNMKVEMDRFQGRTEAFKAGKIEKKEYSKELDSHVGKLGLIIAQKPIEYIGYAAGATGFLASRAGSAAIDKLQGKSTEEISRKITRETALYGTIRIGRKVLGNVIGGATGQRVNPLTNKAQYKVRVNPNEVKNLLLKARGIGPVSPREKAISQAILDYGKANKISASNLGAVKRPFNVWVDKDVAIPQSPKFLLNAKQEQAHSEMTQAMKKVNVANANTPLDIKNQLLAKSKEAIQPLAEAGKVARLSQEFDVVANTIFSSPDFKIAKSLLKPNAAKNTFKTFDDLQQKNILQKAQGGSAWFKRTFTNMEAQMGMVDGDTNVAKLAFEGKEPGPMVENFIQPSKIALSTQINTSDQMLQGYSDIQQLYPQDYLTLSETYKGKKYPWLAKMSAMVRTADVVNGQPVFSATSGNLVDRRLLANSGIDNRTLAEMINSLTANEKRVIASVRKFEDTKYGVVNSAKLDATGEELGFEKGYLQRNYKGGQGRPGFEGREQALLNDLQHHINPKLKTKAIEQRVNPVEQELELNMERDIVKGIDEASRYVAWAPFIKEKGRLLQRQEKNITAQYGEKFTEGVRNWMNDISIGSPGTITAFDRKFTEQWAKSFKFILTKTPHKIALYQAASAPNAIEVVGAAEYQNAFEEIIANPTIIKEIMAESAIMRSRFAHLASAEIAKQQLAKRGLASSLGDRIDNIYTGILTAPMNIVDTRFAGAAYLSGKRKWLKLHPGDLGKAQRVAEDTVGVSQPMTQTPFRPEITRRGAIGKLLSRFTTQRGQMLNRLAESTNAFKNGNITLPQYTKSTLLNWIIPGIMIYSVGRQFTQRKYQAKSGEQHAAQIAQTIASGMPAVAQYLGTMRFSQGQFKLPGLEHLELGNKAILDVIKLKDDRSTDKIIKALAKSVEGLLSATKGINLQVPKNIAAGLRSFLKDEFDIEKVLKAPSERFRGKPKTKLPSDRELRQMIKSGKSTEEIIKEIKGRKKDKLSEELLESRQEEFTPPGESFLPKGLA